MLQDFQIHRNTYTAFNIKPMIYYNYKKTEKKTS